MFVYLVELSLVPTCVNVLPFHEQVLRVLKIWVGDQLNVFEGLLVLDVFGIVRDFLELGVALGLIGAWPEEEVEYNRD